ncbi:unnamed protein product [Musa acuminata var. zebrina]
MIYSIDGLSTREICPRVGSPVALRSALPTKRSDHVVQTRLVDSGGKLKPLKQPKSEKKEYDELNGNWLLISSICLPLEFSGNSCFQRNNWIGFMCVLMNLVVTIFPRGFVTFWA